ncbi:MAG: hypothetical protein KME26_19070 [Oscillatoria princeps RMCB-10]|nr:hypothetical protein [Oscillatoria princeps RMCB-10]
MLANRATAARFASRTHAKPIDMDKPGVLEQALTAMSHQELLALVLKLASNRADFCHALLANINPPPQSRNSQQFRQLKQQITELFEAIKERCRYFEREHDEDERYTELDPIVERAKTLPPPEKIQVFWHLVTRCNQMFEDEFPIGTQQLEEAIGLYAEAVAKLAPSDKQPYFDSLAGALTWEMCGYGDVSDAIEKALATLATAPEDARYIIAQLQKTDYCRSPELIASFYLKLGDDASYLKVRQAHLVTEENYLELAKYWQRKGEKKKYIATLEAGAAHLLEKRHSRNYSFDFLPVGSAVKSSELLQTLADYYELKHDRENLCRILMAVAEYSGVSVELYQKIKDLSVKLGTWQLDRPKLLERAQRNPETLAQIYLYEADWQAALELAHRQPHAERLQVLVAEGVKEHHPQKSVQIYEQLVQHYIDLKSRDHYRTAARHADAIKSIYLDILNEPDIWRQYIDALRLRYPRHQALQDEFRRR